MTRKSHKGIVGKAGSLQATKNHRYKTGEGIGFKEENLTSSKEIEEFLKETDKR